MKNKVIIFFVVLIILGAIFILGFESIKEQAEVHTLVQCQTLNIAGHHIIKCVIDGKVCLLRSTQSNHGGITCDWGDK